MDEQMLAIPEDLDDAWFQFDDTAAVDDGAYERTPSMTSRLRVAFALGAVAAVACVGFAAM